MTSNLNPTYTEVAVGDKFITGHSGTLSLGFFYISEVLDMEPISTRFGKPDRVVKVRVTTNTGTLVDHSKLIWVGQLRAGLV